MTSSDLSAECRGGRAWVQDGQRAHMMVLIVSPACTVAVMPHGGPLGEGGKMSPTRLTSSEDGASGVPTAGGGGMPASGVGVPESWVMARLLSGTVETAKLAAWVALPRLLTPSAAVRRIEQLKTNATMSMLRGCIARLSTGLAPSRLWPANC